MHKQILVILVSLLLCATLLVSANPAASVEEQRRSILFPNKPHLPNPFCIPALCYVPCMCGSELDARGCDTCSCLSCNGGEWQLA